MTDFAHMTAIQLIEQYRQDRLSPVVVMQSVLEAAARCNQEFNVFQYVDEDAALRDAQESARRWQRGEPAGPLDGVPIPIKDLVDVIGMPTRHGSLTTGEDPAREDAPCVARLREAGALLFAKTATPEFGWKGLTDSPLAGPTRNPWNTDLSTGGSSGGAAGAVAAGVCAVAHGNDGGGSIRIPASYCGLYGIKPTFGRVPDYPRGGAYDTLASEGPLSRSVADAALFLNVVSRPDHRDWYAVPWTATDFYESLETGVQGLRIGVCTDPGGIKPASYVADAVIEAAGEFESMGARVDTVDHLFDSLRPTFVRYWLGGLYRRVASVAENERHLVDPDLLRVAAPGETVTLAEFSDGVTARGELAAQMSEFHHRYDLLLCPTMPSDPPPVETAYHSDSFDRWRDATPYTVAFNLTGQPAASIPCGMSPAGLPIGLQVVADRFREDLVLRASYAYERLHPIVLPGDRKRSAG